MDVITTLCEQGLVAVLDVEVGDALRAWGLAVKAGGIEVLAVPVTQRRVTETVAELGDEADLIVGITGVVAPEQVSVAVAAGVELVVTPIADAVIIDAAKQRGLTVVAGAATPTEVAWASSAGADLVSLHPLGFMSQGEAYLEAMLRTFPGLPLAVSGGVDVDNGPSFLDAGAAAVFVDRGLFPEVGDPNAREIITTRTVALVEVAADVLGLPARSSLAATRASLRPPRRRSRPPAPARTETLADDPPPR
ncbi:MAG: bifunctional 4-hydroxy-2-oxoglutarate aldolase/2-dehydro-3-deoxy-phosphogluconate aldolase [Myxococcota bacterium]